MRIVFAGTPSFSVPCLQALLDADGMDVVGVVSQPDRRAGRGMRLTPSPVKQAAVAAGIEVITPERLRDNAEALAWLQGRDADVLIVVAFGMILPRPWLDAPRCGAVNVHASLLPRWRGAAPIERAILAGDAETGVCIMRMEEGLDTGGVYIEARISIGPQTTGAELRDRLAGMGARLLLESLPDIVAGKLKPVPQDESGVTYAKKLTNEERIIDWNQPASWIDRQVRCFSPRPGARTKWRGKWLKIIRGEILSGTTMMPTGTVAGDSYLDIACG
ncbi:MAG: methionyl-tRNA formyltransferase, partial [Mariprofundaceae bacterium]|nr:methionyl-tRNA formyltransferase [Mariprofundaceae bacterium]